MVYVSGLAVVPPNSGSVYNARTIHLGCHQAAVLICLFATSLYYYASFQCYNYKNTCTHRVTFIVEVYPVAVLQRYPPEHSQPQTLTQ